MAQTNSLKIGMIGGGMIGGTLATLLVKAGYEVFVASRNPDQLGVSIQELGARVKTGFPIDAAKWADIAVVTIPLKGIPDLSRDIGEILAGKVVIDTNNPYPDRDGEIAKQVMAAGQGSGSWFAGYFPKSKVVKAFNTVYFKTLLSETHRQGELVAIPLASNDREAMRIVEGLVRDIGFDPVPLGDLSKSKDFDVGTAVYNTGATKRELLQKLTESGHEDHRDEFTLEEMKSFVRNHFEDFVNRKKSEVALTNFSQDFLDHDEPGGPAVGPIAAKRMMEGAYQRWPDLRVEVQDILAEENKVMVRNQWTATDLPSGKKIEFHGFVLWRFKNRKIVERWATLSSPQEIK